MTKPIPMTREMAKEWAGLLAQAGASMPGALPEGVNPFVRALLAIANGDVRLSVRCTTCKGTGRLSDPWPSDCANCKDGWRLVDEDTGRYPIDDSEDSACD